MVAQVFPGNRRILALDIARSIALAAMAIFHLTFDLMLFGHIPADTVYHGIWPWFARAIASSFLILAGISLWLAHGQQVQGQKAQGQQVQGRGIRWPAFLRRFALIAGAAALVSIATYFTMGAVWIRWGILHMIAAGSLIGLLFLRLPVIVTLTVAAMAFAAPHLWRAPVFDHPALVWLGLATTPIVTMDYEPVLPWLCPMLIGIALARLMARAGLWSNLSIWTPGRLGRALAWPGQHSLVLYLVHQPVLFGAVWAYTMWFAR